MGFYKYIPSNKTKKLSCTWKRGRIMTLQYFLLKVLLNVFENISPIFDLANRFARSKQLLSCCCCWLPTLEKLVYPICLLTPLNFNMIGRGKGGKEKGKGLDKRCHMLASGKWPIKNKIVLFQTTKSIHFVVWTRNKLDPKKSIKKMLYKLIWRIRI